MKTIILFLFYITPQILVAQKVIMLSINQPPEFGFSISKQDTTIVKGSSIALGADLMVFGGSGEYTYCWSPAATLDDSTLVNPMATPLDTTNYLLTIADKYGCSFSLNYTVNARNPLVSSDFLSSQKTFQAKLFPNPNNGKFKVKITGLPADKIEFVIFNSIGEAVKRQAIFNFAGDYTETLQLRLVSGAYTMQIVSGKEILSRQFIIN